MPTSATCGECCDPAARCCAAHPSSKDDALRQQSLDAGFDGRGRHARRRRINRADGERIVLRRGYPRIHIQCRTRLVGPDVALEPLGAADQEPVSGRGRTAAGDGVDRERRDRSGTVRRDVCAAAGVVGEDRRPARNCRLPIVNVRPIPCACVNLPQQPPLSRGVSRSGPRLPAPDRANRNAARDPGHRPPG